MIKTQRDAYAAGFKAYRQTDGKVRTPNGLQDSLRTAWYDGWYDAKHLKSLGHLGWKIKTQTYWMDKP